MTRFRNLEEKNNKKEAKKTVFTKYIRGSHEVVKTNFIVSLYDNVDYIGHDKYYGHVFKASWESGEGFDIYFGEKGDEFDD